MGRHYSKQEKRRAKDLLMQGKSYREVKEILEIPKSTLSVWYGKSLRNPSPENISKHLENIRPSATKAIKKKYAVWRGEQNRLAEISAGKLFAALPLSNISVRKALLAMLYWAEGLKIKKSSGTKFVNTDPELLLLYITLLRQCYEIDERKLRIGLHLHHYHGISETRMYWSKLLDVPIDQFYKVYIKKRSLNKSRKIRKNFAGMCSIYYLESSLRRELMMFATLIQKGIIDSLNK